MKYNFDLSKLIIQYVSLQLRKPKFSTFLIILLSPLNPILANFLLFVANTKVELMQNGQVVRLENLLNDMFDTEERRISITDANSDILIVGNTNPIIMGNINPVIFPYGDTDSTVDFVVKVPVQEQPFLIGNDIPIIIGNTIPLILKDTPPDGLVNKIKRVVQKYKISGKSFLVQEI